MIANVLGSAIFHEVAGEGLPLIFVHGLGGTSNVWHAQRLALAKLAKIVTLDLPGSGRSDRSVRNFTMVHWADQVAALADHLKLDKFVVVGHSMSTILAQHCAARHAARIAGLILCGPLTELPPAGKEAFTKRAESVQRDGMIAVADAVLTGALTAATREANPVLAGLYREVLLSNDPGAYAAQCQALINGSARDVQTSIRCPTFILVGDQDTVTPLSMAKSIAAAIAGSTIYIVPGTAHLTMAERPDLFNAAIVQYLGAL